MVRYLFVINENWTSVVEHQGVGLEEAVLLFYLCMQQKPLQENWQYPHIP